MQSTATSDATLRIDGLAPVEVGDADTFLTAYEQSPARSAMQFFPRLYFYGQGQAHKLRWERHGDSILLYQIRRRPDGWRMSLYLPPIPFADTALKFALERVTDYNGERRSRIVWVPEGEALNIAHAGMAVRFLEDEYIFDRGAVLAREGGDFRSLRKDLAHASRHGTVEIRPYHKEDQGACAALVDQWRARIEAGGSRISGYSTTMACLAKADQFSPPLLRAMVVEVDGLVRGFAFSGHLAGEMGCNFLGIADTSYRGLSQLLVCRLMAEFPDLVTFNDSTDNGSPGLRDVKNRFRPIRRLGIFNARQGRARTEQRSEEEA